MPGRVCWFCDRYANMSFRNGWIVPVVNDFSGTRKTDVVGCFSCDSCTRPSVGMIRTEAQIAERGNGSSETVLHDLADLIEWMPPKAVGKDFPDVPKPIADAASEVHRCLSVNANRAAISLARAVVEATAKEKGIKTGNLFAKIDKMADEGLIREHTRQAAHEVRLDGNDVAHGDLTTEPPDAAEAQELVTLMDELLAEVYQGPARVDRVRQGRERRKAGETDGSEQPPPARTDIGQGRRRLL